MTANSTSTLIDWKRLDVLLAKESNARKQINDIHAEIRNIGRDFMTHALQHRKLKEIAGITGLTMSYLSQVRSGKRTMPIKTLNRVERQLQEADGVGS